MIQELFGGRKVEINDLTLLLLERDKICVDLDVFTRKYLSFFNVFQGNGTDTPSPARARALNALTVVAPRPLRR